MRAGGAQRAAYLGASFASGVFGAFNTYTLSLWLTTYTSSYLLISLLGNTRSFEGVIVQPIAGAWSDRTWAGWLGRRRPFILVGGVVSAVLLALTPAINRAFAGPEGLARVAPAIATIFLFTVTRNAMSDAHDALLADLTEGAARNRLAGFKVVVDFLGQVGILVLFFLLWTASIPDEAFWIAGGLMLLGVLPTVLFVREPPPGVWAAERTKATKGELVGFLRAYRGALFFCGVVFAYWTGVNGVLPLVSIYTRDILGATPGESQLLPALMLLTTAALAIPASWLGTRFGKRRVLALGFVLMIGAAVAGLVITTKTEGAAAFILAGMGNAPCQALTLPIMADLVPRRHMGLAVGALAASSSVAAPLASVVGGALADVYGPRVVFALMAVMVLLALALVPGVRPPAETAEPSPRLSVSPSA